MSLLDAIDGAVRSSFCIAGSTVEGLTGLLQALGSSPNDGLEESYQAARRFRRLYCDDPGPEPPPPPFVGGQCACVEYRLTNPDFPGVQKFVIGPIIGFRRVGPNQFNTYLYYCTTGDPGPGCPFGASDSLLATSFNPRNPVWNIARSDGQPDTCGNPPSVFPPPSIPPVDVDVEIAPNVFAPFTFVFAPVRIDVNGSLTVPVNISGTADIDLNLNGKLVLAPNFEFQIDPGDFYPDGEPTGDPGGDGQGEGEPTEDPDDVDGRIYAVSVRCRIESDSPVSGIYQEVGPDIYAPRLGSVRFGTELEGVTFWSEDIDVKGLSQVVECPIPWGATRVVFNAAKGVIGSYSAVRSAPRDWPPYLELLPDSISDNR